LAVLAVAVYRSLEADPVTSTWLWPTTEASDRSADPVIDGRKPLSTVLWDGRQKL